MKINPSLKIRAIAGESVVIMQNKGADDMTNVISLNDTSKYLWDALKGRDFSEDDIVALLTAKYEVSEDRARADAIDWVKKLQELGALL